jgi:hypothetical protein
LSKKHKKSPDGSKSFFSRKKRAALIKLLLLVLLGSSLYLLANPAALPEGPPRDQALLLRDQIVQLLPPSTLNLPNLDPLVAKLAALRARLPERAVLGDQEIIVDQELENLSQTLKQLPADQYARFKNQLCADLVTQAIDACWLEATSSATP